MMMWVCTHSVETDQGKFKLIWPDTKWDNWIPTDHVYIDTDGVIFWEMQRPKGTLIQYPDRTKRFINDSFYE